MCVRARVHTHVYIHLGNWMIMTCCFFQSYYFLSYHFRESNVLFLFFSALYRGLCLRGLPPRRMCYVTRIIAVCLLWEWLLARIPCTWTVPVIPREHSKRMVVRVYVYTYACIECMPRCAFLMYGMYVCICMCMYLMYVWVFDVMSLMYVIVYVGMLSKWKEFLSWCHVTIYIHTYVW